MLGPVADGLDRVVSLGFRFHVEAREAGRWRRLPEPVRTHVRWTLCGRCGGRIRRVTVDPAGERPRPADRFEHVGEAGDGERCRSGNGVATPAVVPVPVPWHAPVVRPELAAILAGEPGGTGERFAPVATARGLPGDASEEVRRAAAGDPAGFGHSHLTVRELLAYDWQQPVTREAWVVDRDERAPAGGRAARAAHWAAVDHALPGWASVGAAGPDTVRVTWPWPAWAEAGRELLVCVTRLAGLAVTDLGTVRCVFWFAEAGDGD
jgi:hypothetical protein